MLTHKSRFCPQKNNLIVSHSLYFCWISYKSSFQSTLIPVCVLPNTLSWWKNPFLKCEITYFTNLTNLLLAGIASSVLQPFYKPYKLYKPFARRYTILRFTNLLLECIPSPVLQTFHKLYKPFTIRLHESIISSVLQTFYKPFALRYIILCFTNLWQTLQTFVRFVKGL